MAQPSQPRYLRGRHASRIRAGHNGGNDAEGDASTAELVERRGTAVERVDTCVSSADGDGAAVGSLGVRRGRGVLGVVGGKNEAVKHMISVRYATRLALADDI